MFRDCGKNLVYLEGTHAGTGRSWKLQAERALAGVPVQNHLAERQHCYQPHRFAAQRDQNRTLLSHGCPVYWTCVLCTRKKPTIRVTEVFSRSEKWFLRPIWYSQYPNQELGRHTSTLYRTAHSLSFLSCFIVSVWNTSVALQHQFRWSVSEPLFWRSH